MIDRFALKRQPDSFVLPAERSVASVLVASVLKGAPGELASPIFENERFTTLRKRLRAAQRRKCVVNADGGVRLSAFRSSRDDAADFFRA